mgnify:CR=1 FL=1
MQKRIFIIHGWEGYPEEAWFPWIKTELEKRGFTVSIPAMPNTENPKIEIWIPYLEKIVGEPDENTCFIGHSIGCQTILRYLAGLDGSTEVGGAVFVAGWVSLTPMAMRTDEEKRIMKPWFETPIDFQRIRNVCKKSIAIFSDDDKYVPFKENSKTYQEKLGAKIILEHQKGHFGGDSGIKELPSALNAVLEISGEKL